MSDFSTQKITVSLTDLSSSAHGARAKRVVETLLANCPDLTVYSVDNDTAETYQATLKWCNRSDVAVRVGNSGMYVLFQIMTINSDKTAYNEQSSASKNVFIERDVIYLEITKYGQQFLIVGAANADSYYVSAFAFTVIVDQFNNTERVTLSAGTSSAQYYELGNAVSPNAGDVMSFSAVPYINPGCLVANGVYSAIPAAYVSSYTVAPFSGFPKGPCSLYYTYSDGESQSHPTRLTRFSIDGKNFISLTDKLCLRTD